VIVGIQVFVEPVTAVPLAHPSTPDPSVFRCWFAVPSAAGKVNSCAPPAVVEILSVFTRLAILLFISFYYL
jgi:hypothetical protein